MQLLSLVHLVLQLLFQLLLDLGLHSELVQHMLIVSLVLLPAEVSTGMLLSQGFEVVFQTDAQARFSLKLFSHLSLFVY